MLLRLLGTYLGIGGVKSIVVYPWAPYPLIDALRWAHSVARYHQVVVAIPWIEPYSRDRSTGDFTQVDQNKYPMPSTPALPRPVKILLALGW